MEIESLCGNWISWLLNIDKEDEYLTQIIIISKYVLYLNIYMDGIM